MAAALVSTIGQPAPTRATTATPAAVTTASVSTASVLATDFVTWLNRDRAAAGLAPIQVWPALTSLANVRSGHLATAGVLSHAAAGGNVGPALTSSGIPWLGFGEIIGQTGYPWGAQAAASLYAMWKASPIHHAIMFSATYNYLGAGFVRRSDGSTWSSVVFTQSPDHTAPIVHNGALSRAGTTLYFRWSGRDVRLQTLTAGLRGFNVLYRVDSGAWRVIRRNTTATGLALAGRAHRHWYSFRVQAVDRRGNLSGWTSVVRIWVP
jgi:uncharacterized protein YkwD